MNERLVVQLPLLEDIPEGCSLQKADDGRRFTCVRDANGVHVLSDRCPHQGYPLSQGEAKDGVLTCAWHNWKFEVGTGACTFGGEAVRRFPSTIEDGRVVVDVTVDVPAETRRLEASLGRALGDGDAGAVVRDGLRLGDLLEWSGPLGRVGPALERLARLGARRARYGFDHPLATLADLCAWVERGWLDGPPALAVAATLFAEAHIHLPDRPGPDAATEWAGLAEHLREERREEAESSARAAARSGALDAALAEGFLPHVSDHLLAYGHGAIYTDKARTLWERFPELAEPLAAALSVQLGWSTRETSLPPWRVTRAALDAVDDLPEIGAAPMEDRLDYEQSVLTSERAATEATLARLRRGVAPAELLLAAAHAAAIRITRFDDAWERRLDAQVGVLGVTHPFTFADSALALTDRAAPRLAARLAVQAAAFVGQVHRGDRAEPPSEEPSGARAPTLEEALTLRDGRLAGPLARAAADRPSVYRRLAPHAAFDASVRPIRIAHAVKVTEAARRMDARDPQADHVYLEAALSLLLPRWPERSARRTASLAERVLSEGRPPVGLY